MADGAGDLTLYHALPSRSARVLQLVEELGDVPCNVKTVPFNMKYLKSEEFLKVNPMGRLPTITDHNDVTVNESGACILFLLKRYGRGRLQPPEEDAAGWAAFYNWMFRAEVNMAMPLALWSVHAKILPPDQAKPDIAAAMVDEITKGFRLVEAALEGKDYLINNTFTAADIMVGFSVGFFTSTSLFNEEEYPNIRAYDARLKDRPSSHKIWDDYDPSSVKWD